MQIVPYLSFGGKCRDAFAFYQSVLGGEITHMIAARGTPAEPHVAPENVDDIMHARLIGEGFALMGGDAPPLMYQTPAGFSVSLQFDNTDEGKRVFDALAEGGTIIMPFEATFWAAGFGMCHDRFGTPWMVNCEIA